jgi:hypothetical protein
VQGIEKMAGTKSEENTWLYYTIQPFDRQFFDAITSLQVVASSDWHVFFFLKHM